MSVIDFFVEVLIFRCEYEELSVSRNGLKNDKKYPSIET